MARIEDLPAELITSIISHLDNIEDVWASRLANKHLERSSFPWFGRRYFKKKGFLITTPSISVLSSIASHEELRKYVRHIWFNPDMFSFVRPECERVVVERDQWYAPPMGDTAQARYEAYKECKSDYEHLLYSMTLEHELTNIFAQLPNMEAIGMRRSTDYQPWGWRKLRDDIGEDPRILGAIPRDPVSALSAPTHLFRAIVNSLAVSESKVKRFYTDAIEIDNFRPDLLSQKTLDAACRSIKYLEINASKAFLVDDAKEPYRILKHENEYGEGLIKLLRATPNLLELGLQIFRDALRTRPVATLPVRDTYRQSYPFLALQNVVKSLEIRHLTRLKLEKVISEPATLRAFLSPSQSSLISVKIRDIRLLSTTKTQRPWQPIFEFLHDKCQSLSYLLLYHLMYEGGGVSFVENPFTPAPNVIAPNSQPAGGEHFTDYDNIALEVKGKEEVKESLGRIVSKHWYQKPIFSYAMDESMWHTDTSDEDW